MENLPFWFLATVMAGGVTGLLTLAAFRGRGAGEPPALRDMQVYKDQLAEVERDVGRGTLGIAEAQRLRTEIARRLLEADRQVQAPVAAAGRGGGLAAFFLITAAAGGALALYHRTGTPWYPDMPIAGRLAEADAAMADRPSQADWVAKLAPPPAVTPDADYLALMEELRAQVDPATATDPRGLELLARNELALGNFAAAIAAQRRLIEVKAGQATAEDHSALAEMLVAEAAGYVSPEAEAELVRALELNPQDGLARYYSGLMFAQGGRFDRAFGLWQPLLEQSPPDAPWTAPIRAQIEEVAALAGVGYTLPAERGPSAGDIDAAADMAPEDRTAMIEGMVEQLSDRLAAEGGTVDEWAQLIRSLGILGRVDEARAIHAEAQTRFAGREADLALLADAATSAGITP